MATLTVDCDAGEKVQQKIALAKPGDTVLVSGTCRENLAISSEVVRITLDGQGKAVIQAPGTTADAIFIRGKDITVKGFTLTGGRDAIHLSGAAAGASAIIDGNTIQRTGRYGIHVDSGSVARIVNNRIENIPNVGIDITENSHARIGFLLPSRPDPVRTQFGIMVVMELQCRALRARGLRTTQLPTTKAAASLLTGTRKPMSWRTSLMGTVETGSPQVTTPA